MKTIVWLLFGLAGFSANAFATTPGEVAIGGYLREAPLYGLFYEYRTLSEFRGKPLIINVWASWCGPCRAEMGSLERLSRRIKGKQLNIIGISTDDNGDAAVAFISKAKVTFDNFLDRKLVLENMLGASQIPLTVLVDAQGRVVKKIYGAHEWDSPEYLELLRKTFGVKL
jgi:thiol-disulfide isomerase/thioredoxin